MEKNKIFVIYPSTSLQIFALVPTVKLAYSQLVCGVRRVSNGLVQELQSTIPVGFINVDMKQQIVNGCPHG